MNEQDLIQKFPEMANTWKPIVYYGGYAYFTHYIERRPNDWRYEKTWITYRAKADGTGEAERFGFTDKETDPESEKITKQEYRDWGVLKAIISAYGKDIFFEK